MSDRNGFGHWAGGRGSPFLSSYNDPTPRNISQHFEYIGPDDELYSQHRPAAAVIDPDNDPEMPDRIHCKYDLGDRLITVNFDPFSINEETALVGDLRKKVASGLHADPSKVRLVYKSRNLNRNREPLKRYGMKQNSEVTVVLTERSADYNHSDTAYHSGSDSDASAHQPPPAPKQRPRAPSSVRLRSEENIPTAPRSSASHLHPNGHIPSSSHRDSLRPTEPSTSHRNSLRPAEQPNSHRDSLRPTERVAGRGRDSSRNRGQSPAPPTQNLPPADPNSALGKVQALSSVFYTQWLPPSTRFLLNPPSDPDVRKKEYLRLTESIMTHVVLKADDIMVEDDKNARAMRKALLIEAQDVSSKLDAVPKK